MLQNGQFCIFSSIHKFNFTSHTFLNTIMKRILLISALLLTIYIQSAKAEIIWASKVISYSTQLDLTSYSAKQVLGPPSRLPSFGDCGCMVTSMSENYFEEHQSRFRKRMRVSQIVINENFNAGSIKAIYLFDQYNIAHLVYERNATDSKWVLGRIFS